MVYCGKPSRACAECRVRRTKCDYKRPSCSQCVRASRSCHGYRDPSDLMFRDESQSLCARRERVREPKGRKNYPDSSKSQEISDAIVCSSSATNAALAVLSLPDSHMQLGPSADEQATCFFFQNYAAGKDNLDKGGFHYLFNIYSSEDIGTALAEGVTSLGLVGLAYFWGSSDIMYLAMKKYNSSLMSISKKLRSIDEAKSDQIMIATILLGLYETNTYYSRDSMERWTQHLKGATSLLQLRGIEQLDTPLGYSLFVQLRTQVTINCIQRHTPVPSILAEWSQIPPETVVQAAANQLALLAIRYCNLRASMSSFNDFSDPKRIIEAACAIDTELALWAKTCPAEYIYQTLTLSERTDEVFSDYYHYYNTTMSAIIWNHYRSNRILVNDLILTQLNWMYLNDPQNTLLWDNPCFSEIQIMRSNSTSLQLCQDICASVPYFLGYDPSLKASDRLIPQRLNGNLVLWPLYTAGVTNMVSDLMRNWVAGRLRWIADVMGIRQAAPLVLVMTRKKDLLTCSKISVMEEDKCVDIEQSVNVFELDTSFDNMDPNLLNDCLPSTMKCLSLCKEGTGIR